MRRAWWQIVGLLAAAVALRPATIAEAGDLIHDACVACHTEAMLDQQRLTPKQWAAVVKKMQGWGAPLEPGEPEALAGALAALSSTRAAAYQPARISAQAARDALAPLPDGPFARGDAERGKADFAALCALCHGPGAEGGPLGVNLVDRPLLYRARDFAAIVRSGRNRMPAFQAIKDAEVADLLAHLRRL